MKQWYYPYEIDILTTGMQETIMSVPPPMDTVAMSRRVIDEHARACPSRSISTKVDTENVSILMREFDIERREAEDALERVDDDLYQAAVDLVCT